MANSPELSEGRFSFNQFVVSFSLSLHLVHLPLLFLFLPFCPLPLSGNKAAFSFQSCPSIVGSGVRIQWSCRCPSLHQYFLLRLSLSFLPPNLLQGSRLLCARLGFLQSSVLFAFLSAQSSVSSFVMMRSLVGPVVPPFPFFFLFSVSSLRLYTLQLRHHLPNGLKSVEPGELKGSRLA